MISWFTLLPASSYLVQHYSPISCHVNIQARSGKWAVSKPSILDIDDGRSRILRFMMRDSSFLASMLLLSDLWPVVHEPFRVLVGELVPSWSEARGSAMNEVLGSSLP